MIPTKFPEEEHQRRMRARHVSRELDRLHRRRRRFMRNVTVVAVAALVLLLAFLTMLLTGAPDG